MSLEPRLASDPREHASLGTGRCRGSRSRGVSNGSPGYSHRHRLSVRRGSEGAVMSALTSWVLRHKRVVVGFWFVVTIAAFVGIKPAGDALAQQFDVPGREGFETNKDLAAIYGNGGNVAPLIPVVKLARGKTVDSPGVSEQLAAALAKVEAALPNARTPSFASTHDRAFVSDDGPGAGRARWLPHRPAHLLRVEPSPVQPEAVPEPAPRGSVGSDHRTSYALEAPPLRNPVEVRAVLEGAEGARRPAHPVRGGARAIASETPSRRDRGDWSAALPRHRVRGGRLVPGGVPRHGSDDPGGPVVREDTVGHAK